jgi:hypothetical protein
VEGPLAVGGGRQLVGLLPVVKGGIKFFFGEGDEIGVGLSLYEVTVGYVCVFRFFLIREFTQFSHWALTRETEAQNISNSARGRRIVCMLA